MQQNLTCSNWQGVVVMPTADPPRAENRPAPFGRGAWLCTRSNCFGDSCAAVDTTPPLKGAGLETLVIPFPHAPVRFQIYNFRFQIQNLQSEII